MSKAVQIPVAGSMEASGEARIITRNGSLGDAPGRWQDSLKDMFTSYRELAAFLDLPIAAFDDLDAVTRQFPLRATRAFVSRIRRGDPDDPLLRQIMPDAKELQTSAATTTDPLAEKAFTTQAGVVRKYRHRALFILTGACAIHCRYCFRRHFPYEQHRQSRQLWDDTVAELAIDPELQEIILSGGDPLMLDDHALASLFSSLQQIPGLQRIRLHTRMPSVLPGRITSPLIELLRSCRQKVIVVNHINHAHEIDESVVQANRQLREVCTLLNQTVLLKGVNDSARAQIELSHALFDAGILPYYLHLPDAVDAAGHFMMAASTASELYAEMLTALPGYLVPRLVYEDPGYLSKVPLQPALESLTRKTL
ncbi:EF-P beta-lysylation protein EpmB [Allohahella marinimesophila]|uniref:L-lysine 2,3-aminomutase n=1 Tax=Allohahella marinimesophila TaxID=1054972 RepID=A0ABP7NK06_9GAMM